jgi:hypothetical protein
MKAILRGGPRDGLSVDLADDTQVVRLPSMGYSRVLTATEMEDPANWEIDPWGYPRLKRPPIRIFDYRRTDDVEDGQVVFR